MNLKTTIQGRPGEFILLCKSHDVNSVYAFGSSLADNFNEDSSDIDLLVELGQNLLDLWGKLEAYFQRKVDLLTSSSIRNSILRKNIDSSKVFVYDSQGLKVSF